MCPSEFDVLQMLMNSFVEFIMYCFGIYLTMMEFKCFAISYTGVPNCAMIDLGLLHFCEFWVCRRYSRVCNSLPELEDGEDQLLH